MNCDHFIRRTNSGIPYYTCKAFDDVIGLHHGFTTRHGGAEHAAESFFDLGQGNGSTYRLTSDNRRSFMSALHLGDMNLVTLRQVHSGRFIIISEKCNQGNPSEGDALITRMKNVALAVLVADCLPVLVVDPVTRVIAAIHAGWKGILARIVENTVAGMRQSFGSAGSDLMVAIGPGIRSCCFEVGQEVISLFEQTYPIESLANPHQHHPGKWFLDLRAALNFQFSSAGIKGTNIFDMGTCTRCNTQEFFSYRGEGASSGRMLGIIAMDS
jgi:polyphenol oxidase